MHKFFTFLARSPAGFQMWKKNVVAPTENVVGYSSKSGKPLPSKEEEYLPPSVDWRKRGAVTKIGKQGPKCFSCYAFAAVGAVEGIHKITKGELVPLSVQQIIDFDTANNGSDGGRAQIVFDYISKYGITTAKNYPYVGRASTRDISKIKPPLVMIKRYNCVASNERALLKAVARQPVVVSICSCDEVGDYEDGVYEGPFGETLNHAVTIVGYGTTDTGIDYWIIKNSWGETWGENGYMRLVRGTREGKGGITVEATYPVMSTKERKDRNKG